VKILHSINGAPPVGGVTKSVENLHFSLIKVGHESFLLKDIFKKIRYDVGHIHASNIYKRLAFIILFKFFCRKVIFTVHGFWLDKSLINRLCVMLSSGVIILNEKLYVEWTDSKFSAKFIVLPILYKEGLRHPKVNSFKVNKNKKILLYSSYRKYINGQEVYGIDFALSSLSMNYNDVDITLIDIDGGYKDIVFENKHLNIDYYDHAVNFEYFLQNCDIYLRPTCMDGSSVAVQEALLLGKRVIASDIVERGDGVELYKHLNTDSLLDIINSDGIKNSTYTAPSVYKYVEFVSSL